MFEKGAGVLLLLSNPRVLLLLSRGSSCSMEVTFLKTVLFSCDKVYIYSYYMQA